MIRLFHTFIPISTLTLLLGDAILTSFCFIGGTYFSFGGDAALYLLYENGMIALAPPILTFVIACYFSSLYSDVYVNSRIMLLQQLSLVTGITFIVEGLVSSFGETFRLPVRVMMTDSFLSLVSIFFWRLLFSRYAAEILGDITILFVGADPVLEALGQRIGRHSNTGLKIVGYVEEDARAEDAFELTGVKCVGRTEDLEEIVAAIHPSRVAVAVEDESAARIAPVLEMLRYSGQRVDDAAQMYEQICGSVWLPKLNPASFVYDEAFFVMRRDIVILRIVDVTLAGVAAILCSPFVAVIWAWLRLRSPGSALFCEERQGMLNTKFPRYRFRLPGFAGGMDAWIENQVRRWRLDALPELWNVLAGDMALVGPSPHRPEFADALGEVIPFYPQRHCVRPGMTGWTQTRVPSDNIDAMTNLASDLYYIKYMSLSQNTIILAQTFRSIFSSSDERKPPR